MKRLLLHNSQSRALLTGSTIKGFRHVNFLRGSLSSQERVVSATTNRTAGEFSQGTPACRVIGLHRPPVGTFVPGIVWIDGGEKHTSLGRFAAKGHESFRRGHEIARSQRRIIFHTQRTALAITDAPSGGPWAKGANGRSSSRPTSARSSSNWAWAENSKRNQTDGTRTECSLRASS
jgi:hypothetical protein